jgi:hypothetical protein
MAEPIAGSPASTAAIQAFEDSIASKVAGSQDAEDTLHAFVEPLVGAADPAALTTAQLNQKWSGIAPAGWTDSVYPTAQ